MTFMLSRTSSHTLQPPWGGGLVAGFSLNSTYSAHLRTRWHLEVIEAGIARVSPSPLWERRR